LKHHFHSALLNISQSGNIHIVKEILPFNSSRTSFLTSGSRVMQKPYTDDALLKAVGQHALNVLGLILRSALTIEPLTQKVSLSVPPPIQGVPSGEELECHQP
jgi:hypothetical protein